MPTPNDTTTPGRREARATKQERLQALWDSTGLLFEAMIEFRPFNGWYAQPYEARYFNDCGDFMGSDYSHAERGIKELNEWAKPKVKP